MSISLLDAAAYQRALCLRDLTDAAAGPHAMQLLVSAAIAALRDSWGCPVIVQRQPPVVTVDDNYDRLHVPPEAVARDARYTRYVTTALVLRTHTTAAIPGLLRALARAPYADVLLACPGVVYRRDALDRLHAAEPHQLDLWRIRAAVLGGAELRSMITHVVDAVLPGAELRTTPATHPYTRDGLQLDVRAGDRWVEIGECGVALPALLEECGLPPGGHAGLAMGLGLDRILMLRKGIDDIRLLRSTDPRVAAQMRDLAPYRAVSAQPPIRRDLSLAVASDATPEELGDRVRERLGLRAECIEAVEVRSETPADALSTAAAARLGISPGQKNVLLRVVLRHPTRTLTTGEANGLRDEVYAALHAGSVHTWAGGARAARARTPATSAPPSTGRSACRT
jgi:phenylalanyl-tRNA synthetase alpha chain